MCWTKQHSQNAVAAKARKRMAPAEIVEPAGTPYRPRRAKADFIIRIEDRFGERVQVSAFRYFDAPNEKPNGSYICTGCSRTGANSRNL